MQVCLSLAGNAWSCAYTVCLVWPRLVESDYLAPYCLSLHWLSLVNQWTVLPSELIYDLSHPPPFQFPKILEFLQPASLHSWTAISVFFHRSHSLCPLLLPFLWWMCSCWWELHVHWECTQLYFLAVTMWASIPLYHCGGVHEWGSYRVTLLIKYSSAFTWLALCGYKWFMPVV